MKDHRPLRSRTNAAWKASRSFNWAFQWCLYNRRFVIAKGTRTRLYVVCTSDGSAWKFGVALDPEARLSGLQIGSPQRLILFAHTAANGLMERYVHHVLRRHRIGGEWFAAGPRVLAMASLVESAQEQTDDMERYEYGPCDAGDTVAIWTAGVEDAVLELNRRNAA